MYLHDSTAVRDFIIDVKIFLNIYFHTLFKYIIQENKDLENMK